MTPVSSLRWLACVMALRISMQILHAVFLFTFKSRES